ncbi:Uncharacterised protein [Mycobacteroides abscessus subsp. abscessus]|nr:Uncharacterised protein [Mycobacteroides abscessus subsp. abscessus]
MDIEGRQQHRIPHRATILTTAADHPLLPGLRELGDPPITDPIRGYLSQILHGDSLGRGQCIEHRGGVVLSQAQIRAPDMRLADADNPAQQRTRLR